MTLLTRSIHLHSSLQLCAWVRTNQIRIYSYASPLACAYTKYVVTCCNYCMRYIISIHLYMLYIHAKSKLTHTINIITISIYIHQKIRTQMGFHSPSLNKGSQKSHLKWSQFSCWKKLFGDPPNFFGTERPLASMQGDPRRESLCAVARQGQHTFHVGANRPGASPASPQFRH